MRGVLAASLPAAGLYIFSAERATLHGEGVNLVVGRFGDDGAVELGEGCNLCVDVLHAVAGVGVVGEELGSAGAVLGLDDLKELGEAAGVEVGAVEDVDTEEVGLLLVGAGHAEEVQALADAEASLGELADGAVTEEDAGADLPETVEDGLIALMDEVAGGVAHDVV